jgi:hypothetical protein
MATRILLHDRWIYLGAALFLTASAFSIRYAIRDIISLIKIETEQALPKPEQITVGGEVDKSADGDSLSKSRPQCLGTLSSANVLIRDYSYQDFDSPKSFEISIRQC